MTQSNNRTPLKQNNRMGQSSSAPKMPVPNYFDVVEEKRIDWERKQKGKKSDVTDEIEDDLTDEVVDAVVRPPKSKKQHKKKHRQIIYDDERDQMIVKRKRRRQADYFFADDFE
ncbi:MAG: hypothetical protein CUN52_06465 [Phototrophicales bacterium]|nr:MAG: hypothetical protein CUN52_06465 [Phototrophicales bacterium]